MDEEGLKMTNILNAVYISGKIPQEWLRSEFIRLPKKAGAKVCSEYPTISLMSHLLKSHSEDNT